MGGFFDPQMMEGQYQWFPQLQQQMEQWLKTIQGAQMPTAPAGLTEGISRMQQGARQNYPMIEQMLRGQVQTGGLGPIEEIFGRMGDLRNRQTMQGVEELMARSSVTPSSMRGMTGALADQRSQSALQDLLTLTGLRESAMGRQMGAAGQLAGLPSAMWGAPTSLEQALYGANIGWEQNRLGQLGNYYGSLPAMYEAGNWGTMTGSPFDRYIGSWLSPLMQGFGQALPFSFNLPGVGGRAQANPVNLAGMENRYY